MMFSVSIFLLLVASVSASFISNQTCSTNGCTVVCPSKKFDLQSSLTKNGITQRFFTKYMLYNNYYFAVPLCGTSPANITSLDWSQASVFQQVLQTGQMNYLGLYNSNTVVWTLGSCDDATTLQTTIYGGTYCSATGQNRQTTIYLTCDERYNARYPSISVTETSTCKYSIQVAFMEMCSSTSPASSPVPSPTLSPSITHSPLSYPDASTSCVNEDDSGASVADIVVTVVVIVIVVGGLMACAFAVCMRQRNINRFGSPMTQSIPFSSGGLYINPNTVPNNNFPSSNSTLPANYVLPSSSGGDYCVGVVTNIQGNTGPYSPVVGAPTEYSVSAPPSQQGYSPSSPPPAGYSSSPPPSVGIYPAVVSPGGYSQFISGSGGYSTAPLEQGGVVHAQVVSVDNSNNANNNNYGGNMVVGGYTV